MAQPLNMAALYIRNEKNLLSDNENVWTRKTIFRRKVLFFSTSLSYQFISHIRFTGWFAIRYASL